MAGVALISVTIAYEHDCNYLSLYVVGSDLYVCVFFFFNDTATTEIYTE